MSAPALKLDTASLISGSQPVGRYGMALLLVDRQNTFLSRAAQIADDEHAHRTRQVSRSAAGQQRKDPIQRQRLPDADVIQSFPHLRLKVHG